MLRDKNNPQNLKKLIPLIFFFFFIIGFINTSLAEQIVLSQDNNINQSFSASLKNRIGIIYQNFVPALSPISNGIAFGIDKNYAITAANVVENLKNASIVSLDSKLGIAIIKSNNPFFLSLNNFELPSPTEEIFFLLTIYENPSILVVKGKQSDMTVDIQGNYPKGSLLVSVNLNPVGIVVKNGSVSHVLLVKNVATEINKLINRKPGWAGLQAQTITPELSKILLVSEGVVVTNIYETGPSDKAGLKRGDVIIDADGFKIKELKDLQNIISTKFAGETLKLKIVRDSFQKELLLTLEEPPELLTTKTTFIQDLKGVDVTEIPESLRSGLRKSINGVFVKRISEESPALGILKEGDIIVEINKKSITNIKEFNEIMAKSLQNDVLILVYRQDSYQYVIIPQQKSR